MIIRKEPFLLVLAFLLCYNLSYAGELLSKEAAKYYNEGVRAQKTRDFISANTAFKKALLLDPYNPKWHRADMNNFGIVCTLRGEFDKAEWAFKETLKIEPNYKPAMLNLGLVYELSKPRLEALEYWMKVLEFLNFKPKDFIIEEGELKPEESK